VLKKSSHNSLSRKVLLLIRVPFVSVHHSCPAIRPVLDDLEGRQLLSTVPGTSVVAPAIANEAATAPKTFQSNVCITVDGIAGPQTDGALSTVVKEVQAKVGAMPPGRPLSPGGSSRC
jgi:hypothetical protein